MKALVLCALFMSAATGTASAFDDPAVAVCEYSWTRGADLAQAGIRRVSEDISGDTVTLTYEQSVLNTKPQVTEQICHFQADMRGELTLKFEPYAGSVDCLDVTSRAKAAILQFGSQSTEAQAFAKPLNDCLPVLQAANDLEADRLSNVSLPLLMMGIYPIKPESSELVVPIDRAKFQADCDAKQADRDKGVVQSDSGDRLAIDLRACKDAGYLP